MAKVHRATEFSQEVCLKLYIDTNTELRKNGKHDFANDFFNLMNSAVFGKTMENMRKHRCIKLVTTETTRNYLVSEPNYHTIKNFTDNLVAIEMKRTWILMNKPVYIGLLILEISNIAMYEFWYDYKKPKIRIEKSKIMLHGHKRLYTLRKNRRHLRRHCKRSETRFGTLNYELEISLPKEKNLKVTGLMKDKLGGKLITELAVLRPKTDSYLIDDPDETKKAKDTIMCVIKTNLNLKNVNTV